MDEKFRRRSVRFDQQEIVLGFGLDFASNSVWLDFVQIGLNLLRNEQIELVEWRQSDFARLQCFDVYAAGEGAFHNCMDCKYGTHIRSFLTTSQSDIRRFWKSLCPIGIDADEQLHYLSSWEEGT